MKREMNGLYRLVILFLLGSFTLPADTISVTDSASVVYPTQRYVITLETYPNSSRIRFIDRDSDTSDVLTAGLVLTYSLPEGSSLNFTYAWADVHSGFSKRSSVQVTRLDPVGTFAPSQFVQRGGGSYDNYSVDYFPGGASVTAQGGVAFGWPDLLYAGYNARTVFTYEWDTWFTADAHLVVDYTGPQVKASDTAPEPGTMLLAGCCLIALAWLGAKRGKSCE